jgi:hypothetical protein
MIRNTELIRSDGDGGSGVRRWWSYGIALSMPLVSVKKFSFGRLCMAVIGFLRSTQGRAKAVRRGAGVLGRSRCALRVPQPRRRICAPSLPDLLDLDLQPLRLIQAIGGVSWR